MIQFYRLIQPLLVTSFGILAQTLKHTPFLREKSRKLWMTWEIRSIAGRPAFLGIDPAVFKGKKPIWIHAASGEFEYAKPIIREISNRSLRPVLVTYFSPTYAENVARFPGVTASCPLPLDSVGEIERFLDHLDPAALLIARTDTWPNMVSITHERKIPILLFSATFHAESKRLKGAGRRLTVETLRAIDTIQCVSDEDRQTLENIGLSNAVACGDSRYDQVLARLAAGRPLPEILRARVHARVFTAGSVWSEDLIPVLTASRRTQDIAKHTLVIVPHEISEGFLREIETQAARCGIASERTIRFSELAKRKPERVFDMIIVDTVGLLAELYSLGEVAFVGGSFKKTVHSVMEPLAAGCLTLVGPKHLNNREAIEFQTLRLRGNDGLSFVTAVETATGFTLALEKIWQSSLKNPSAAQETKNAIRNAVAQRGGATAHVLRWLERNKISF